MFRYIIIVLFLGVAVVANSVNSPNQKLLSNAYEHFDKGEWEETLSIYDIFFSQGISSVDFYAPAIIAAGKLNDYKRAMGYIVLSEKFGVPITKVLDNSLILATKIREFDIYEKVLICIKEEQPWFNKMINDRLLKFYHKRHLNNKAIEVANDIIADKPKDVVNVMLIKAESFVEIGSIDSAAIVMEKILLIDNDVSDARIFLGNYYYVKAIQEFDSDTDVVDNEKIYSFLQKAGFYFDSKILKKQSPFIREKLKEIELIISSIETQPL